MREVLGGRGIEDRVALAPHDHDRNPVLLNEIPKTRRLPTRREVPVRDCAQRLLCPLDAFEAQHALDHLRRDEVRIAQEEFERPPFFEAHGQAWK